MIPFLTVNSVVARKNVDSDQQASLEARCSGSTIMRRSRKFCQRRSNYDGFFFCFFFFWGGGDGVGGGGGGGCEGREDPNGVSLTGR